MGRKKAETVLAKQRLQRREAALLGPDPFSDDGPSVADKAGTVHYGRGCSARGSVASCVTRGAAVASRKIR